jgi:hypothetical protein
MIQDHLPVCNVDSKICLLGFNYCERAVPRGVLQHNQTESGLVMLTVSFVGPDPHRSLAAAGFAGHTARCTLFRWLGFRAFLTEVRAEKRAPKPQCVGAVSST